MMFLRSVKDVVTEYKALGTNRLRRRPKITLKLHVVITGSCVVQDIIM